MGNPIPFIHNDGEKTIGQRIIEKKTAQLDGQDEQNMNGQYDIQYNEEGSISTHPLEGAIESMSKIQSDLSQISSIASRLESEISQVLESGDTSRFMDDRLSNDPALWEKAEREIESIRKKILTVISLTYE